MPKAQKDNEKLRIIAGKWRGKLIKFRAAQGLRPTSDRIRETLFNWLMNDIKGAHCLDLFAGSGALGFEALSRGAASVTMVDQSQQVIQQLQLIAAELPGLGSQQLQTLCASVPKLQLPQQHYDIIFVDPPFNQQLIEPTCQWLNQHYVHADSLLYLETEKSLTKPAIPDNWQILKSKAAGQVRYYLIEV